MGICPCGSPRVREQHEREEAGHIALLALQCRMSADQREQRAPRSVAFALLIRWPIAELGTRKPWAI